MSRPVVVATPEIELEAAVQLMVAHNVKRLPVVENDRLVGIVSISDFARYGPALAAALRAALESATAETQQRFAAMAPLPPAEMYH